MQKRYRVNMSERPFVGFLTLLALVSLSTFASRCIVDSEVHDVAVTYVTAWPTFGLPQIVYVNATVENQGTTYETFNLTVCAGDIIIQNVTVVDLAPGQNQTLAIEWDAWSFRAIIFPQPWRLGMPMVKNLTVWAEADEIASETDTSDNVYVNGIVAIIWWCIDINGDGKVDGKDVAIAAKAFGSLPGDPRWSPWVDFNQDGKIDGKEIAAIAKGFGARYA